LSGNVDPELARAWLTARSVARGLPEPVPDLGGFRVDTNSENEVRRWLFAGVDYGLSELGRSIREPCHLLKLCGTTDELAGTLPAGWAVEGGNWLMELDTSPPPLQAIPSGYCLEQYREGGVTRVEIRTEGGDLAASGYAAETSDAFVYDRIVTDPSHRRRGLGRALIAALGSCRRSEAAWQLLVATAEGEKLYSSLGWCTLSPYSTAYIPERSA
jgi:GNAT superfamily N-acetyltransferase